MNADLQPDASSPRRRPGLTAVIVVLFLLAGFLAINLTWGMLSRPTRVPNVAHPPPVPEHSAADYSETSLQRDQCRKIISAVRAYRQKQGALPLPEGSPQDEAHVFQLDATMFAALSGETTAPTSTSGVNYFKPWGLSGQTLQDLKKGAYYVCFDFNGDSHIPDPAASGKDIEQDVLVWHAGKDGDPATWTDNHYAWLTAK